MKPLILLQLIFASINKVFLRTRLVIFSFGSCHTNFLYFIFNYVFIIISGAENCLQAHSSQSLEF